MFEKIKELRAKAEAEVEETEAVEEETADTDFGNI